MLASPAPKTRLEALRGSPSRGGPNMHTELEICESCRSEAKSKAKGIPKQLLGDLGLGVSSRAAWAAERGDAR